MATIEDAAVAGQTVTAADGFRPLGQILRDIKATDAEIVKATRRRADLVRELRHVGEAAIQYAENVQ
jgi:hypothetical protein